MRQCKCKHDGQTVTEACMMHAEWHRAKITEDLNVTTVEGAQAAKRDLEIGIMKLIRSYEEMTGLRITKAEMMSFEDTRFFGTTAFLPPKRKKT